MSSKEKLIPLQQRSAIYFFHHAINAKVITGQWKKRFGRNLKEIVFLKDKRTSYILLPKGEAELIGRVLVKRLKVQSNFFRKLFNDFQKQSRIYLQICQRLSKANFTNKSTLISNFQKWAKAREKLALQGEQTPTLISLYLEKECGQGALKIITASAPRDKQVYKQTFRIAAQFIDYKNRVRLQTDKYLVKMYKKICHLLKIDQIVFWYLTPDEIIEFLEKGLSNQVRAQIKKRVQASALQASKGKLLITTDIDKIKRRMQTHKVLEKSFMRGTCASKGQVTGRVIVVKGLKDWKKIKPGSILVTYMTQPRFTTYIKKVKAIVTDDGGITCHAAIVARELSVPCIIGTKFATKIFKDGDKVEVDATKGVVKKI